MNAALDLYIEQLDSTIKQLSEQQRFNLMRKIGSKIRQRNRMRIIQNLQPDGNPMRKRKGSEDYLEGFRKLRDNEQLAIGQLFIYNGSGMRRRNIGELRNMVTIKRPEHDAKYGFPYRKHKGGGRYKRTPYDPDYVQGYAETRNGTLGLDGVSKFNRKHIYVPDSKSPSIKVKLMFRKINQYKYLQLRATSHEAAIGFLKGLTAYIAAAHQYGEDNRPVRKLLGFSDEDLAFIQNLVWQHFHMK